MGLRFAVSEDLGFAPVSRRVRALFRDRVARLSKVVACEAADPPLAGPGRDADRCFEVLRAVGFLGASRELVEQHPDEVGPNVPANVKLGLPFSAPDLSAAPPAPRPPSHRFLAFLARTH